MKQAIPRENTRSPWIRHSMPSFVPTRREPSPIRTAADGSARYCLPGTAGSRVPSGSAIVSAGGNPSAGRMSVSAPSRMVKARAVSCPHTPVRLPSSSIHTSRIYPTGTFTGSYSRCVSGFPSASQWKR